MSKPTVADLMAEIETLKRRITQLEARPPVVIHNHPAPAPLPFMQPVFTPQPLPYWGPKVGEIWCGVAQAAPAHQQPALWNGPRNPDGSCAPITTATLTAHGGGSGG